MTRLLALCRRWWCELAHDPRMLTRPVHGRYQCLQCGEEFECKWEGERA